MANSFRNAIKLKTLISNTECRMLNNEVNTSAFDIRYSSFDIKIRMYESQLNDSENLVLRVCNTQRNRHAQRFGNDAICLGAFRYFHKRFFAYAFDF